MKQPLDFQKELRSIFAELSKAYGEDMLIAEYDTLTRKAQQAINDLIEGVVKDARIDELRSIKKRATEHCAFKIDQYGSDLDTDDIRLAVPVKKIDERIKDLTKFGIKGDV